MSFQAVTWAIEQKAGGPSAKATLWSIANYANENWCAWPSQRTICDESEQSPDAVQRRIPELEMTGLVRRIPLRFAGRKTVDFFILRPSPFFEAHLSDIEPLLPRGCSIDPKHVAANSGSAETVPGSSPSAVPVDDAAATSGNVNPTVPASTLPQPLPQTLPQVAAHAAALERQQEPVMEPKNLDGGGGDARARVLSPACFEIARQVGTFCGWATPADWPQGWSQSHYRVQTWLNEGWSQDAILAACRDVMAHKRDGPPSTINYFDKPIAKWIARQQQPLPEVKVQERETVHVVRSHENPARAAFREALDELKDFNRGASPSGESGREVVGLLPAARSR